jgi:hypothetical protein
MIKLKPLKELLAMSKEKLDEAMAPIRARQIKSKAELEMAKLDEKLISSESRVFELCSQKEINFDSIIAEMDLYALNERRKAQLGKIIEELFPKEA